MPNQTFTSALSTAPPLSASPPADHPPPQNSTYQNTAPSTFSDSLPLPRLIVFDLDYTLWPFWVDTHITPPIKATDSTHTRVQDRWGECFTFYPGVTNILYAARERGVTMSIASRTQAPDVARMLLKTLVVVPPFSSSVGDLGGGGGGGEDVDDALDSNNNNDDNDDKKKKGKKSKDKEKKKKGGSSSRSSNINNNNNNKPEKPLKTLDYFSHMQIFPGSKTTHFTRIQEATRKAGGSGGEVAFADMLFFDDEARNRNVETELGVTFWLVRDGVTRDEVDKGIREWRKRRGVNA